MSSDQNITISAQIYGQQKFKPKKDGQTKSFKVKKQIVSRICFRLTVFPAQGVKKYSLPGKCFNSEQMFIETLKHNLATKSIRPKNYNKL